MKGKIKNCIASIITGSLIAIAEWGLSEFWGNKSMKQHIISFLNTFSPLFIGFLGFLLYWFMVFLRRVYKTYINYKQDRKRMDDKIDAYQSSVILLSDQFTNRLNKIDNRLNEIEDFIRNKNV